MAKATIAEFFLVEKWFQSKVIKKKGIVSSVSSAKNSNETPLYKSFIRFCETINHESIPVRRFIYILETYISERNSKAKIKSAKKRDSRGTVFTNIGLLEDTAVLNNVVLNTFKEKRK